MIELPPKKLVAAYNRGMITGHELVIRFIQAAAKHDPETLLPLAPEELLSEIQQRGENPPERPEDMRFVQSVCAIGPYDHDAWERQQQVAYHDGAWRWHRFLIAQPT